METIDAGDVPLDAVLGELLTPHGLAALVDGRAAACFALARRTLVPELFSSLIANIDAIDRTTRQHIAFIVFHGQRSSFVREESVAGSQRQVRYSVSGLSVSSEEAHRRAVNRLRSDTRLAFSDEVTQQLRYGEGPVGAVARSTEFATSILMDRFHISESQLPCLVFADSDTINDPLTIPLSPASPMQSLYSDVLIPISDAFAKVEHVWERTRVVSGNRLELDRHRRTVETYTVELDARRRAVDEAKSRLEASGTTDSALDVASLRLRLLQLEQFCDGLRNNEGFEERVVFIREHGGDSAPAQAALEELRRLEAFKKQTGWQARDPAGRVQAEKTSASPARHWRHRGQNYDPRNCGRTCSSAI